MRKKGETGVQDRTKPQPMQKKVREEKRSVRRKSLTDSNDNDPDKLSAREAYFPVIPSNYGREISVQEKA